MAVIIEGSFGTVPIESVRDLSTTDMAIIALVIQNFMEITFDEIKRAGFLSVEFLEKTELFLRAVTPSYPKNEFDTLLDVFNQINPNFNQTRFYYGLTALRQICTHETEAGKILLDNSGIKIANYSQINGSLIIFATHLIENIIRNVQGLRKLNNKEITIDELKFKINAHFQSCLLSTIAEVNITINKLKA